MARRASPFTQVQVFNFFVLVSTTRTELRGSECFAYGNNSTTIPLCFILKHRSELIPRHFTNRFGKFVVLNHVRYLQIFNRNISVCVFRCIGLNIVLFTFEAWSIILLLDESRIGISKILY